MSLVKNVRILNRGIDQKSRKIVRVADLLRIKLLVS